MSEKRWIFWINEADPMGYDRERKSYIPARVVEGEPDYTFFMGDGGAFSSPYYWGDLELAKRTAEKANAERGITPQDASDILLSSMNAALALTREETIPQDDDLTEEHRIVITMTEERFRALFTAKGYSEEHPHITDAGITYNGDYWFADGGDHWIIRDAAQEYLKSIGYDSEVRKVPGHGRWQLFTNYRWAW